MKPHTSDFERNNQEIIENGTKFDKRILQTADGSDTEKQKYLFQIARQPASSMDGDDEVSSARRHSASVTTETPPRSPTLVVTCPGSAFPLSAPATQQDSMHWPLMILA